MALTLADPRDADWLVAAAHLDPRVVDTGPKGYDAYARVRYVPDPVRAGQDESDADVPDDHPSEVDQVDRVLWSLRHHTTSPDDCRFALWDGWPASESRLLAAAHVSTVEVPDRTCVLHAGGVGDASTLEYRPAFVWPVDRAWCFTSDVDPHWAVVGGSHEAIAALLTVDGLDVVPMERDERPPTYY